MKLTGNYTEAEFNDDFSSASEIHPRPTFVHQVRNTLVRILSQVNDDEILENSQDLIKRS
jgi:hypothetical protein